MSRAGTMRTLCAAAAILCCGGVAKATTVFSENFNSAPLGTLTAPGTLSAQNTWALGLVNTPGTVEIVDVAPGDRAVSHTATGSGGSSRFWLEAPLTGNVNLDTESVTIAVDWYLNATGTNGDRHTLFQVYGAAGDGYQARLSGNAAADKYVVDFAVVSGGDAGAATDVGPEPPPGQSAEVRYRGTFRFEKIGPDTKYDWNVVNTATSAVLSAGTQTFDGQAVPAGTVLNTFRIGFRQRSLSRLDNIVVTKASTDTTPPVITLNGPASFNLDCGTPYVEEGASALDDRDGDISANIVIDGSVNHIVPGPYTITYNVSDAAGNPATQVIRTVNVLSNCADTNPPVITLNGPTTVDVDCGATYADAGATANDIEDGDITANIVPTSTVNTAAPGQYTVTYNVNDAFGNPAVPVVRTVNVLANCPLIIIEGPSEIRVGDDVLLEVYAPTLTGNLDYQWLKNNNPIPGEDGPTLAFQEITTAANGSYRVVVTDETKGAYPPSPPFVITVLPQGNLPAADPLGIGALALALAAAAALRNRRK